MTAALVEAGRWNPNGPAGAVFHPVFSGRWTPEPCREHGVSTRCPDRWRACTPYPTMGFAASAWITAKCGLRLDPWQVELFRRGWAYDPDTLDWLVEDVLIVGPEGIGKSALFAGVGLWLLDGPCLPPVEEPRPHPRPNIPIVSAALSLTQHIHRHMKHYVERPGSTLAGRLKVENTKVFRVGSEDHQVMFPAGSGSLQQGGEPVPAIIEEELHTTGMPGVRATGEETIRIMSSKRMKNRGVQRWTITNPDDGDPDSLLGQRWRYASRVLDGEVEDPSLLAVHFHAALPVNLEDPEDLRRAIAEATPASWVPLETIARKVEKGEQGVGWTMRFSLGVFYAGDDQVFGDGVLEGAAVPERDRVPPPPEVPVALAFDGARNRDSIALYGCTQEGYGWVLDAWERPEGAPDDWRYDKAAVDRRVREAMEVEHPQAMLAVDPTFFEDFVYGTADEPGWVDLWPDRVVLDVQKYGSAAWTGFRQAVLDGEFTHDGDPRLLRHMRNAREEIRTHQGRSYPILRKRREDAPIDLLVTATYAHRLSRHLEPVEDLDEWRQALGVGG